MWFFVAVLILWATTVQMEEWPVWLLPKTVEWTWWTFHLYLCGIAASTGRFLTTAEKVMGLFGFCLVVLYYRTMSGTYMEFLPSNETHPDMWAAVFTVVNLVGPIILISTGVLKTAVQRHGEG